MYYTGVGSRDTPPEIGRLMTRIATFLFEEGYVLRSGGAPGADTFFEDGVPSLEGKDIYLAGKADFGHSSPLYRVGEDALALAKTIHPNWDAPRMVANNFRGRRLHARNCYQVLGYDLNNPSRFLLCWTEGGLAKGGTRTAIKLAQQNEVPILNFGAVKGDPFLAFELFYMRVAA